jgi:gallate dioxygenase
MPEKPGAVVGVSNLHINAAMRGGQLEAFRMARDGSGALCRLKGADASLFDWYRKQIGAGS